MRINTKFAVAVHALVLIAMNDESGLPITSQLIAKSVGTNPVVIRRMLSQLKQDGFIQAQAGCPGYRLTKSPGEITLKEIYTAIRTEGEEGEKRALFDVHTSPFQGCPVGRHIHESLEEPLWQAQMALENALGQYTLQEVSRNISLKISEEKEQQK